MRLVIQRVKDAKVEVENQIIGEINLGLLILCGIENEDSDEDYDYCIKKICGLRIFNDENNIMNLSVTEKKGALMVISQFTLLATTHKGLRPSYIKACPPQIAKTKYEYFLNSLRLQSQLEVKAGIFGADMKVTLCNDGPVTIILDSKNRLL